MKAILFSATAALLLPTLVVAPDPDPYDKHYKVDWAPPGKTIIIPRTTYINFENSLGDGGAESSPLWFLRVGARLTVQLAPPLMKALNTIAKVTGDPMPNTFKNDFVDATKALFNPRYDGMLDMPGGPRPGEKPGIITQKGLNPAGDFKIKELPKVTLRWLLDLNGGEKNLEDDIYLSDGPFVHAWQVMRDSSVALQQLYERIHAWNAKKLKELHEPSKKDKKKKAKAGKKEETKENKTPVPVISIASPLIGIFDRQELGLKVYFDQKYESAIFPFGAEFDDPLAQILSSREFMTAEAAALMMEHTEIYLVAIKSSIALMLEMMADIALETNPLGQESMLYTYKLWALPGAEKEEPDVPKGRPLPKDYKPPPAKLKPRINLDLLKKHPEWDVKEYVATFPEKLKETKEIQEPVMKNEEDEEKTSVEGETGPERTGNTQEEETKTDTVNQ